MVKSENERPLRFYDLLSGRLNRCLAPGMSCPSDAIRAHSIQNSGVLDLLAADGHVKAFRIKVDWQKGPKLSIGDVSRKQATTFTGLCSRHDSAIFKPIDTEPFDPSNREHHFLLAYRSGIRELHAQMESAAKIQSGYRMRVDFGLDSGNEPSAAGLMAVKYMVRSYFTYLYMENLGECYLSKDWGRLQNSWFVIDHAEPTIAVSSLFSPDGTRDLSEIPRVMLNVFPLSKSQTMVTFGYLGEDAKEVKAFLMPLLTAHGDYQKYLLSKMILSNCENFVLSPAYYSNWSSDKRHKVEAYFTRTLLDSEWDIESEQLYLF